MGDREVVEAALFAAGRPLDETVIARATGLPERDVLKTAALIAYHQPVLQSRLCEMVGDKAYEHVRELVERNLVLARPEGRSLELTTSRFFPEFFGLKAKNAVEIKRYLASMAGVGQGVPKGVPSAAGAAPVAD